MSISPSGKSHIYSNLNKLYNLHLKSILLGLYAKAPETSPYREGSGSRYFVYMMIKSLNFHCKTNIALCIDFRRVNGSIKPMLPCKTACKGGV